MAIEHRTVGVQSELVRCSGHLQPILARKLVIADDTANSLAEDLRAPSGLRIKPGFLELRQDLANTKLPPLRQVPDLDHRKRLEVHLRKSLLESSEQLAIPIQRQFGMQAADDVELRDGLRPAMSRLLPGFFQRQ